MARKETNTGDQNQAAPAETPDAGNNPAPSPVQTGDAAPETAQALDQIPGETGMRARVAGLSRYTPVHRSPEYERADRLRFYIAEVRNIMLRGLMANPNIERMCSAGPGELFSTTIKPDGGMYASIGDYLAVRVDKLAHAYAEALLDIDQARENELDVLANDDGSALPPADDVAADEATH